MTELNHFKPMFTQAEACEIAALNPAWVNNWIARGHFELSEGDDRRLAGRRLFSVQDIVFFAAMAIAIEDVGMQPADAKPFAHRAATEIWYPQHEGRVTMTIGRKIKTNGKDPFWQVGFVWLDKATGALTEPGGTLPDLSKSAFVLMPCSEIVDLVLSRCRAMLSKESDGENTAK